MSGFATGNDHPDAPESVDSIITPNLPFTTQSAAVVEDEVGYFNRFVPEEGDSIGSVAFDIIAAATAVGELQTCTVSATGGNLKLGFGAENTANIPYTTGTTAATIQSALLALDAFVTGDVVVTGSAGGPYTLTFGGNYANQDVPAVTADASGLTGGGGTAVMATTQAGKSVKVDVGIYEVKDDTTISKLASTGPIDGENAVGIAVATFTKAVKVQGGKPYYVGFASKDASAATILIATTQAAAVDLTGATAGKREVITKTAAFPLPKTVPVGSAPNHAPVLALRV